MPARVVRGEINSSDSLSRVSIPADLTFRALLVAVDDFGRIDGRLPVLRGLLFPLRPEVSEAKLERWIGELGSGPDPLLIRYEVDGRPFVALTGWEKHRGKTKRAASSRCPEPPPRRSADPREISGDPPESRSREKESREGIERDPRGKPRRSVCVCPERLSDEEREGARQWARANRFTDSQLAYGWARVRDWAAAGGHRRADWLAVLRNAISDGWALKGYTPPASGPGSPGSPGGPPTGGARRPAEDVLAAAKAKQAEDDARARDGKPDPDDPAAVASLIEQSLRPRLALVRPAPAAGEVGTA